LAGLVVAVETSPSLLTEYYGHDPGWTASSDVERVREFIDRWAGFSWKDVALLGPAWFAIEQDVAGLVGELGDLRSRGLAAVQLCHWGVNQYFSPQTGVSATGRALLREMADGDVLADLTHVPLSAMHHVLGQCPGRKILSHVVCEDVLDRSLVRRSNAFPSNVLEACSAELYAVPFIDDIVSTTEGERPQDRNATISVIARHLKRMAEVVGIERVALGPDYFCPAIVQGSLGFDVKTVAGMDAAGGLSELAGTLAQAGWTETELEAVFWRNALRVLGAFPGQRGSGCLDDGLFPGC
jgi:microsomal dipeptidase-like Zn-dependent dipeptidase